MTPEPPPSPATHLNSATSNPPRPRVASLVWNLIRGGTEGQCARVALACARRGDVHRVAVFRREGHFLEEVESVCGPVPELPIRRLATWSTVRALRDFSRWLRAERIDLLHAWDADAAVFGSCAARWAGIPFLTSRRDLGDIYAPWKLRRMRGADRRSRGVVVNASRILDRLAGQGLDASRIHLIPNLVDIAEFDRLAAGAPPSGTPDEPFAVMVARLDPEKDVGTVIHAAAPALAAHPEWRLVIAGEGGERSALETLAGNVPGGGRIVFLGEVTSVPALLSHAAIGILLPHANEGLSNSILEYMAAGLPSVVTDCGGNAELIEDGVCGRVVPVSDAAAAGAALTHLIQDAALRQRLGQAARQRLESRFDPDQVVEQFRALYARSVRPAARP